MTVYFEDLEVGDVSECGNRTVTRDEIVAFAERYDPQPFHTDEEAARESTFGGLVASGLHTLCLASRLAVEGFYGDLANLAGRGMDDLRWHRPVYPGDSLSVRIEVLDKDGGRPDRGDVRLGWTVRSGDGEVVLTVTFLNVVARRPGEA